MLTIFPNHGVDEKDVIFTQVIYPHGYFFIIRNCQPCVDGFITGELMYDSRSQVRQDGNGGSIAVNLSIAMAVRPLRKDAADKVIDDMIKNWKISQQSIKLRETALETTTEAARQATKKEPWQE